MNSASGLEDREVVPEEDRHHYRWRMWTGYGAPACGSWFRQRRCVHLLGDRPARHRIDGLLLPVSTTSAPRSLCPARCADLNPAPMPRPSAAPASPACSSSNILGVVPRGDQRRKPTPRAERPGPVALPTTPGHALRELQAMDGRLPGAVSAAFAVDGASCRSSRRSTRLRGQPARRRARRGAIAVAAGIRVALAVEVKRGAAAGRTPMNGATRDGSRPTLRMPGVRPRLRRSAASRGGMIMKVAGRTAIVPGFFRPVSCSDRSANT